MVVDWNPKRTVAVKKKMFHVFPFNNAEESVFYDWNMIHFFYVFVLFYELIYVCIDLNVISTYFVDCVYLYE